MSNHYIQFRINNLNSIVIKLEESLEMVHCCYEAPIILIHEKKEITLSDHSVREFVQDLKYFAEQLVCNQLQLHESITKDPGFLLNEDLQYKPGLFTTQTDGYDSWIGYNYLLVMGSQKVVWFYNTSDGKIIYEVTPKFPFSYRNYAKDKNYIPYKTWIKNYKPYFITQASPHFIAEWITQSDTILKIIEKNIKRYHENR
jgi:hypothetical protein